MKPLINYPNFRIGRSEYQIIDGNSFQCALSAAIFASATGSIQSSQINYAMRNSIKEQTELTGQLPDPKLGDKWAVVKRIKIHDPLLRTI